VLAQSDEQLVNMLAYQGRLEEIESEKHQQEGREADEQ
jgi:hypothetical protein